MTKSINGRCFRCDGMGCAECLDLANFRLSQEMSGRATRALMESLRVCCGQPDTCERDCPPCASLPLPPESQAGLASPQTPPHTEGE